MLERFRHLHFGWIYFIAALFAVMYLFLLNNTAHPDLWGHFSFGALFEANGQFPYRDVFSYTAPHQMVYDHEWGAGMIFYGLTKNAGSSSLFWLQLVLYGCALGIPLSLALKQLPSKSNPLKELLFALFFPLLALLMCTLYMPTLWAHNFTFFFLAILFLLLEQWRLSGKKRFIVGLPLLFLLWVNTHGGFIVGFFVLGIYFMEALIHRTTAPRKSLSAKCLILIAFLCFITILLTPYGVNYIKHIWTFWFLDRSDIVDWDSVFSNRLPPFQPFYGIFYTVCFLFWSISSFLSWKNQGFKTFPRVFLLILATGLEGLLHYKLVPIFVITVLGVGFQLSFPKTLWSSVKAVGVNRKRFRAIAYYLTPLALLISASYMVFMFCITKPQPFSVHVSDQRGMGYPIGAVNYLKEHHVQGNLWSTFVWGEFLYWNLYPNMKVAMDGRFEVLYPLSVFQDFMRFATPPHDLEIPLKYGTTHLLVPNNRTVNKVFFDKIEHSPRWHKQYQDTNAVLYSATSIIDVTRLVPKEKSFETGGSPLTVDDFFRNIPLEKFEVKK